RPPRPPRGSLPPVPCGVRTCWWWPKAFPPHGLRRRRALWLHPCARTGRRHGPWPAKPGYSRVISIARSAFAKHPARRVGLHMLVLLLLSWGAALPAMAEDGYDLWLRYRPLPAPVLKQYRDLGGQVVAPAQTGTQRATRDELVRGLAGLLGREPGQAARVQRNGAIVVGTPAAVPQLSALQGDLEGLGEEGYLIRRTRLDGRAATVVAATSDIDVLYDTIHLLRLPQSGEPLASLDLREAPDVNVRVLNHWDNLDRYVERGYAGESIWDWHKLPDWLDPRYTDYARANASIGINGTVLNNVNTSAQALTPMYLEKAAALASVFRPY